MASTLGTQRVTDAILTVAGAVLFVVCVGAQFAYVPITPGALFVGGGIGLAAAVVGIARGKRRRRAT